MHGLTYLLFIIITLILLLLLLLSLHYYLIWYDYSFGLPLLPSITYDYRWTTLLITLSYIIIHSLPYLLLFITAECHDLTGHNVCPYSLFRSDLVRELALSPPFLLWRFWESNSNRITANNMYCHCTKPPTKPIHIILRITYYYYIIILYPILYPCLELWFNTLVHSLPLLLPLSHIGSPIRTTSCSSIFILVWLHYFPPILPIWLYYPYSRA